MQITNSFKRALLSAAALSLVPAFTPYTAIADPQSEGQAIRFSIPPQALGDALRVFSEQSGTPVLFSEDIVSGKTAPGLEGAFSPDEGLRTLLGGSGLEAVTPPGGTRIIREIAEKSARRDARPQPVKQEEAAAPVRIEPETEEEPSGVLRADKVTVTGTSLRGLAPESSPLQIYGRDEV